MNSTLIIQGDPKKSGPREYFFDICFIHSPIALILQDMAGTMSVNTSRCQWKLQKREYCVKHYYKTSSFKKVQDIFCASVLM